MNLKNNNKVPIAILSCFLIAFILQGALKLGGVLVFEKALDWEIFEVIDGNKFLNICYYSLIVSTTMYCLSFALTTKCYSNKWYHYVLIAGIAITTVTARTLFTLSNKTHIILDLCIYIVVPFVINLTTNSERKLFKNDSFGIITTLSINILIYLCYLGLGYWSGVLNSLLPINPLWLSSSANFLIQIEVYIGIVVLMLSMNILVGYIKRSLNMYLPINIASETARLEELKEIKAKKSNKKDAK